MKSSDYAIAQGELIHIPADNFFLLLNKVKAVDANITDFV